MMLFCSRPPALSASIVRTRISNFFSALLHSNDQCYQIKGCYGDFIHSFIISRGIDSGQAPGGDTEEVENSRPVLASLEPHGPVGETDSGSRKEGLLIQSGSVGRGMQGHPV